MIPHYGIGLYLKEARLFTIAICLRQEFILNNWKIAKKEKEEELSRIYYAKEVSGADIEGLIQKLKIDVR